MHCNNPRLKGRVQVADRPAAAAAAAAAVERTVQLLTSPTWIGDCTIQMSIYVNRTLVVQQWRFAGHFKDFRKVPRSELWSNAHNCIAPDHNQ
jgi:hypothetical protein